MSLVITECAFGACPGFLPSAKNPEYALRSTNLR